MRTCRHGIRKLCDAELREPAGDRRHDAGGRRIHHLVGVQHGIGLGLSTYLASPPAIGGTSAAAGAFTTLSASSTVSGTGFSAYLASPPDWRDGASRRCVHDGDRRIS